MTKRANKVLHSDTPTPENEISPDTVLEHNVKSRDENMMTAENQTSDQNKKHRKKRKKSKHRHPDLEEQSLPSKTIDDTVGKLSNKDDEKIPDQSLDRTVEEDMSISGVEKDDVKKESPQSKKIAKQDRKKRRDRNSHNGLETPSKKELILDVINEEDLAGKEEDNKKERVSKPSRKEIKERAGKLLKGRQSPFAAEKGQAHEASVEENDEEAEGQYLTSAERNRELSCLYRRIYFLEKYGVPMERERPRKAHKRNLTSSDETDDHEQWAHERERENTRLYLSNQMKKNHMKKNLMIYLHNQKQLLAGLESYLA
ncbi:protein Son-like isoform X3 [Ruditapes philippinarum]|uniref:protein Son-like isoform X3 n=1 Tax=Ruditapes philippinarum TaxID=129788 RepID=UPI00295C1AAD|nr:protein Son-like isoform X3 [Ruditapes philippinarum]